MDEAAAHFVAEALGGDEGESGAFHGGDKPSLVDINVYGVMRSLDGFDAQVQTLRNNKDFDKWYSAMRQAVGKSAEETLVVERDPRKSYGL